MLSHAEFCTLTDTGHYRNPGLAAGWMFWCHRAELDASGAYFAVVEDTHTALAAQMAIPPEDRGEDALQELVAVLAACIALVRGTPDTPSTTH